MHTLIVDDHAFVCVGLKATLLDGLSDITVSTASDVYIPEVLLALGADSDGAVDDLQTSIDGVTELLTERQLDILKLISKGLSNKLIARELFLSENTIKVDVSAILRALNLSNRTQAGLVGQKLEIISATQFSENGGL